jgi:hypothetical protein
LYLLANALAGVGLVLLLIDPGRDLAAVFFLLTLAAVCVVVPRFPPHCRDTIVLPTIASAASEGSRGPTLPVEGDRGCRTQK